MIDAEDPHVRAAPRAALLDRLGGRVEDLMKETGPLETPFVDLTMSFFGPEREKEKPVPPPLLWMSAVCLIVSKMLSIESSTGRTKQAESCPSSRPRS